MKKLFLIVLCFICVFAFSFISNAQATFAIANEALKIEGRGCVLLDASSGKVLFCDNENERYPIASMTKIMTLLLTFEAVDNSKLDLDGEILVSKNASSMGGSQVFLDADTVYKTKDLIKSVVVASANDASVALAEKIAGSEENFVVLMNQKAKQLGLENTNFANSTGLPSVEGYSSAKDCAVMFKELINFEKYFDFSKIYLDTLKHPSGRETTLTNTNKLVRFYEGCDGGKTGSTNEAKFCLCATAYKNNMRLIACVLGCDNSKIRNAQVSNLFNFGFNNYRNLSLVEKGKSFEIAAHNANINSFNAVALEGFSKVVGIDEKSDIKINEVLETNLKAPIKQGDKVGEIIITDNGEVIKKIDIVSTCDVSNISFGNSILKIFRNWSF